VKEKKMEEKTETKETKKVKKTEKLAGREERVLSAFRREMEKDKDEGLIQTLEKILELRNAGMSGPAIAEFLKIGRDIIYRHTHQLPCFLLSPELGEIILAARALNLTVAEYVLLCHVMFGVVHAKKHGKKAYVNELFALAAGQP
jgi:hypothetical protein